MAPKSPTSIPDRQGQQCEQRGKRQREQSSREVVITRPGLQTAVGRGWEKDVGSSGDFSSREEFRGKGAYLNGGPF